MTANEREQLRVEIDRRVRAQLHSQHGRSWRRAVERNYSATINPEAAMARTELGATRRRLLGSTTKEVRPCA